MITIKTDSELDQMRESGRITKNVLDLIEKSIRVGMTTKQLDKIAYDYIKSCGATPSFLGYGGYPASICASIDEMVVHGIPNDETVIKDGQMLETLTGGKHILNDVEPPKKTLFGTKKFISEPHDYQVFYVNNNVTLLCKWGTPNQIKIFDPFLKVPVNVGAFGTFDISVLNSRKFMLKLVGNVDGITTEGLRRFFADKLVMRVKDVLANAMVVSEINFYELPTKLVAISETILNSIRNIFEDYGVEIVNFSINHIQIPDSDTRTLEEIIKKKRR